jgi:glutaredoxin
MSSCSGDKHIISVTDEKTGNTVEYTNWPMVVETAKKLLASEKFAELLEVYNQDQLEEIKPPQRKAFVEIYYQAALKQAHEEKDLAFSNMFCQRALLFDPENILLIRLMAENYMAPEMSIFGGAEELADQLLTLEPENYENHLLRGRVALAQAEYQEAIVWFKQIVDNHQKEDGLRKKAVKLMVEAKQQIDVIRSGISLLAEIDLIKKKAGLNTSTGKPPKKVKQKQIQHKIILYLAPWCSYCIKTRELLKKLNAKFKEVNVEKDRNGLVGLLQYAQKLGVNARGVPIVRIGDELVVGYDPQRIITLVQKLK